MADVRGDRAQLLLAGGLALAVVLVGLALVVNAVIYTENVATREEDPAADALRGHASVVEGAKGIIDHVNSNRVGAPYGTLYGAHYGDAFVGFRSGLRTEGVARGTVLQVSDASGYEGTQIIDDSSGVFEPQYVNLGANWTVASASHVRAFTMNVSVSGLTSANPGTVQTLLAGVTNTVFITTIEDQTGRIWQVAIYENADTTGVTDAAVTVRDVQTGTYHTCTQVGSQVVVDFSEGELRANGDRNVCPGLDFFTESSGPVSVAYGNGDKISGTYALIADRGAGGLRAEVNRENGVTCTDPSTYSTSSANPPYALPAIYGTTVTTDYSGPSVTYSAAVWAAPNEPGPKPQVPQVRTLSVFDRSNETGANDRAKFDISWTVADPNGDAVNTTLTVTNTDNGNVTHFVDIGSSGTRTITGATGTGTVTPATFTFKLEVRDGQHRRSVTKQQDSEGKQNDCGGDENSPPAASFSYSPSSPEAGESVSFDGSSSGDDGGIDSYEWDFDADGNTDATGVTASHTFTTAGSHDVSLTVTDGNGETDTETRTVTVSATNSAPSIDSIAVTDSSSASPGNGKDDVVFDVAWDVSDPDADLDTLRITLIHVPSGSRVDTVTVGLAGGGSPQSGSNEVSWKERGVFGDDFRIELRLEDTAGNVVTDSTVETADGGAG